MVKVVRIIESKVIYVIQGHTREGGCHNDVNSKSVLNEAQNTEYIAIALPLRLSRFSPLNHFNTCMALGENVARDPNSITNSKSIFNTDEAVDPWLPLGFCNHLQ